MEVVQKISEAPTDANGRVTDRVEMTRVTIRDTPPPEPEPFTTESTEDLATLSRGARDLAGADHARVPAGQGARPRAQFPAARLARRLRWHCLPPRRPRVRPPGRHAEHAHQPGAATRCSSTCARSHPEFNDTPHVKGTLSMARTDDPNSASTSFFICTGAGAFARRQVHGVRARRRRNGGRGGDRGRPGRRRIASAAHRGDEGHCQDGMMAGLKSALQIGPSGPRVGRTGAGVTTARARGKGWREEEASEPRRRVARGARARLGAPEPARARVPADDHQPPRRARAARLVEVADRRGGQQIARRPARCRLRLPPVRQRPCRGRPRLRCRWCSASRPSGRSPTCASPCSATSSGCRCATSIRRRPASSSRAS